LALTKSLKTNKSIKMKKLTLLSSFCFLLLTLVVKAQTPPNAFNYSAVARNAAGQPIATTTIGIQITILKTSPTGASQYSENHFVNTDAFGLFNLVIGAGAVQSGSMATIDWSNDNYYLKVGMDAAGGTNFLTMGTTQLLSVPYAMYAKSAGSVSGGGTGGSFTHYIGEEFGGGVIFHLWKDAQGVEHGLIVDKTDLSTSQVWSNVDQTLIGPAAQSSWDGLSNSNAIVAQAGHTNSAAALCLNSTNGGQSDWYLPSIEELERLYTNRLEVNAALRSISGATEMKKIDSSGLLIEYWSSSEIDVTEINFAWVLKMVDGPVDGFEKNDENYVRAVRFF
jgi:hypothetical protein